MNRNRLFTALIDLVELVARLRGPGGCPWDAKQTFGSVRMYLLEEAYEVLDAIERGEPREICQELGDLLFQILFLSHMGEESGGFDLVEVMTGIHEKMVRRHPHIFASTTVKDAEEVSLNWARIKKDEKKELQGNGSCIGSVPSGLPALLRAHRLTERASKAGGTSEVEHRELVDRIHKCLREIGVLEQPRDRDLIRRKMGDLLFGMADLSRKMGFNAEDLLRDANQRFSDRFQEAEEGNG
ncbi:MAG: nucleoside triphosphate pyrophosphohydrolase [Desulfobacteraceae bacterium]|nr:MAG: nucleoside triphosphate pyrophosphohydrolase [Desulfobacteraceae bacterium]